MLMGFKYKFTFTDQYPLHLFILQVPLNLEQAPPGEHPVKIGLSELYRITNHIGTAGIRLSRLEFLY